MVPKHPGGVLVLRGLLFICVANRVAREVDVASRINESTLADWQASYGTPSQAAGCFPLLKRSAPSGKVKG